MNEAQVRSEWAHAVVAAPAIPIEIVLAPSSLDVPDFRGIDDQGRRP